MATFSEWAQHSTIAIFSPKYSWSDTLEESYSIDIELSHLEVNYLVDWIDELKYSEEKYQNWRDSLGLINGISPPPYPTTDGILIEIMPGFCESQEAALIMDNRSTKILLDFIEKYIFISKELIMAIDDCRKYF